MLKNGEKKFNLDDPDGFQKYWHAKKKKKKIPEENYSTRHREGGFLMIWGPSHLQENLNYSFSVVDKIAADYVKMLTDLSLAQEGSHLCEEE